MSNFDLGRFTSSHLNFLMRNTEWSVEFMGSKLPFTSKSSFTSCGVLSSASGSNQISTTSLVA